MPSTTLHSELVAHIEAFNARTGASFHTDLEGPFGWTAMGVATPAEFDRYLLASDVLELSKSLWGYKPSWSGLMSMGEDELRASLESLKADAASRVTEPLRFVEEECYLRELEQEDLEAQEDFDLEQIERRLELVR